MTAFEDTYSLWTYNFTTEWIRKNGVPDMLLCMGLDFHNACTAARRLKLVGMQVTVKDIHNIAISVPVVPKGQE